MLLVPRFSCSLWLPVITMVSLWTNVVLLMVVVGALAETSQQSLARPWLADLPINRWPVVQAHDAATGYLAATNIIEDVVYAWTRTQGGNFTSQLACGARSLDWRPAIATDSKTNSTELVFHHGPITIPHSMLAGAQEVVAWANRPGASQTEDELVMLSVWDCVGDGCWDAALAAFKQAGLPAITGAACDAATNWTLADAMAAAALPGGGHVVALVNCPYWGLQTYNGRIGCTGFKNYTLGSEFISQVSECGSVFDEAHRTNLLTPVDATLSEPLRLLALMDRVNAVSKRRAGQSAWALAGEPTPTSSTISWPQIEACLEAGVEILDSSEHYACYNGSSTQAIPFGILKAWNTKMAAQDPPPALLYWLQGAWAEHIASIVFGFLHKSSLLLDETRSSLNARYTEWIATPGLFKYYPGGVGINAVCDGGQDMLDTLREQLPAAPAA